MQNSPLKNEKKDLVKKDGSQLKTAFHSKRQKKKLKKGKEIQKMKKGLATIINIFLLLLFYIDLCFVRKNIWKN